MSIVTAWSPFFQSRMRMRGRAYHLAGRVKRVAPETGELVRAQVQGRQLYTVTIRQEGRAALAECTCPTFNDGAYCKHIWATLLDIQHAEVPGPGASTDQLQPLRVRAPRARKRDESETAVRSSAGGSEPEWMGRLSLLRPPTIDAESRSAELLPPQREVCYVVLPGASTRHGGLVVELRQRTPTLTGWSKPKALRITGDTIASLTDATDRELCSLILGASYVDDYSLTEQVRDRSGSTFRLPPSARRAMLARMVATGRCYIDIDEENGPGKEAPLRYEDEATHGLWVLWMVGDEVADELVVRVELRRGHERLAIDEPQLVFGGPEGMVFWGGRAAPFDDRGAARWVSQFRGERKSSGFFGTANASGGLRIAKADVQRFLDRLYMLPALPEIDLPEHLTRHELQVKPAPQLELYSPDSRVAADFLPTVGVSGGSATLKNQLVARVWFDYAGQRVDPMQAGRFVTVGESGAATAEAAPAEVAEAEVAVGALAAGGEADAEAGVGDGDGEGSGDGASGGDNGLGYDPALLLDDDEDELAAADLEATEEDQALASGARLIRRDHRAERDAYLTLSSLGFRQASASSAAALLLHSKQMPRAVFELASRGWVVTADQRVLRRPGSPTLSVASGIDWFELRGTITFERADGQKQDVGLPEILAAARNGEAMITLGDGSLGLLPEQWLEEHGLLAALGKAQGDHLRFKSSQAALLDGLLRDTDDIVMDEPFRQFRERLHQFKGMTSLDPAPEFQGTLRPYQREGLGWLSFLRFFGVGGILADDMGLGKTIQVLAMIQSRKREREAGVHGTGPEAHAPVLIVAPKSLIFNWLDEAQKFTPDLRAVAYSGADRDALRDDFGRIDVIVTSYGLLRRDIEQLREHTFDYVVLDEAQAIKNPNSQAAKAARLLQSRHRIALTGTPVENHLGDLWSIFEFLNPGMLGTSTRFGELVRSTPTTPVSGSVNGATLVGESESVNGDALPATPTLSPEAAMLRLAGALRPFILRRTKKQVLSELPEKTEQTIVCEMEPAQRQVYDDLRKYYRGHLLTQADAAAPSGGMVAGQPAFMVLEALLRLRQAACHPGLIDDKRADEPSAKLETLLDMLGDVVEEGGKALIFSQFTSMLALVRKRLDAQGVKHCYLDGQTRDRKRVVEQFQGDPTIPVFLISLKAGGFGLNLTAAEYVFILDPWWNPAVEQQAIDRTHRIGQTRRVFAYRMICEDTVEQRILDLQARKRKLADAIVDSDPSGGDLLRNLTRDDLEQLLS